MDEIVRKRVLLLSPDFGFGGAERSIARLSILLAVHYEVFFVIFNRDRQQVYPVGGTVYSLEVPGSGHWPGKILGFIKRIMNLRRIKRRLEPHVSISFLEGSDYINLLSRHGDQVIMSIRGSKRYDNNIRGVSGFVRHRFTIPWVYRNADALAVVDPGIAHELKSAYGVSSADRARVIPNFYDTNEIRVKSLVPLEKEWEEFFQSKSVIVASGRLSGEKGFDLLLKIFFGLQRNISDAALVIVGEGPLREKLFAMCSSLGMPAGSEPSPEIRVVFTGYLGNPFPIVSHADLFVLSSLNEGFPNVLLEAMTLGVPVVAGDCPYGPSTILGGNAGPQYQHEYGILLPVLLMQAERFNIWTSELQRILSDSDLRRRYQEKSRERAEQFTPASALALWQSVIEHEKENSPH